MPKVSVIIPVYNVEKYLPKCLDSVVNQTFKDIEIICVNDGSPDNSLAIMKKYAKKDKRIKIIDQKNAGLGAARNVAAKQATGEYLFFVDSDDWISEDCVEKLYRRISECKADLCIYGMLSYNEQQDKLREFSYYNLSCYGENVNKVCTYKDLPATVFRRFGAFLKLYKTSWFRAKKLYYAEGVHFEDVVSHVKAMILAKRICFVNENLYYYRVNRLGSIMNANKSVVHTQDVHRFIKDTYEFIKKQKILPVLEYHFAKFMFEQLTYHYTRVSDIAVKEQFAADSKKFVDDNFADIVAKYPDVRNQYYRLFVQPSVSVIVPVYNAKKYLQQCLDSVLNQTLTRMEIICVNDGSTDGSLKILQKYAKKDKRIKVINQENQGLSCSRNNALKIAGGEYVAFLDSDDYWRQDALEILYMQATVNNLDMLSFGGTNFDDKTGKLQKNDYYQFKYLPEGFNTECFNYQHCSGFITHVAISSCLTMYNREFLQKNHITFPPHLFFEDNLFFAQAFLKAKRCGICRETLYFRRVHPESVTQNWNKHFADYLQICEKVIKFVRSMPVSDEIKLRYFNSYTGNPKAIYEGFGSADKWKYRKQLYRFLKEIALQKYCTYKLFGCIPLLSIEEK